MTSYFLHSMQQDVATFHDVFGHPNSVGSPRALPSDRVDLRLKLIREEGVKELCAAISAGDVVEVVDALVDTAYVSFGALVEMGYPAKVPYLFEVTQPLQPAEKLLAHASWAQREIANHVELLKFALEQETESLSVRYLSDIIKLSLGTLTANGIDPHPFFDEVHRANMSKLGDDGLPVRSRGMELDGAPLDKIIKGPNYRAPDLAQIFANLQSVAAP